MPMAATSMGQGLLHLPGPDQLSLSPNDGARYQYSLILLILRKTKAVFMMGKHTSAIKTIHSPKVGYSKLTWLFKISGERSFSA